MQEIFRLTKSAFEQKANPVKAIQMSAYLKDHFKFYGVQSPARKEIVRKIWKNHKQQIVGNWRSFVKACWEKDQREYQYIAMDIMPKLYRYFEYEDLDLMMDCIQDKSWWDTVDLLASGAVGYIISQNIGKQKALCDKWIISKNMWVRRTALLHQLKYKDQVNLDLLFELILKEKGSTEFFINKASGWSLRQASKFYPSEVSKFLKANQDLSNLTKREGSKYL